NRKPFRFLDLPAELREMVYEELLEDPYYPPLPAKPDVVSSFSLAWRRPSTKKEAEKKGSWILLANKQVHGEYIDVLCKKTTYHLTVSPENYHPTTTITGATIPIPVAKLWTLSPQTLSSIRSLTLKLITTSSMLGVRDPRNMTPSTWALARQIRAELSAVNRVKELNLHVKAIGDPLWNPLWVWYHAAQSFKSMGTTSGMLPMGPKVSRITFSLDTWSPGENYLARSVKHRGAWAWHCTEGHFVVLDFVAPTVREFCAKLYAECRVCNPGDGEEEEEE
ncbi:hypothetical protein P154DRAFT_397042, partial [Amniculicola lignicola CBS 123094]